MRISLAGTPAAVLIASDETEEKLGIAAGVLIGKPVLIVRNFYLRLAGITYRLTGLTVGNDAKSKELLFPQQMKKPPFF